MARRYTKSEKAAGQIYLLAILAAVAVAAMLSFAFYLYPLFVAVVVMMTWGVAKTPPAIEDAEDYNDDEAHDRIVFLVAELDAAEQQFETRSEAGKDDGCDLTKTSNFTRFDPRTRKGKEANRELDKYDDISQAAAHQIKDLRSAVNDRLPDWRAEYDHWAAKAALRKALRNALLTAFVIAGVYQCVGMTQAGFGGKLNSLAQTVSVALLWKPQGFLGLEPLFLAAIVSYVVFALSVFVLRVALFNSIDANTKSEWEAMLAKWSADESYDFFRDSAECDDEDEETTKDFTAPEIDWRTVLEVDANATIRDIKMAYHHQIKMNHGDQVATLSAKIRQAAETETVKINVAFDAARAEMGFR
jgi:hypothetical protein